MSEDEEEFEACPECEGTGHMLDPVTLTQGDEMCWPCDGTGLAMEGKPGDAVRTIRTWN